MEEGKLLGHIISKDGIHINSSRVVAIQQIDFLCNKKEIQAFHGKMNFLRRFIPNLAENLCELNNMLKKESTMKWIEDAMKSFNLVKLALTTIPVLISLDYTHDFIIFSFASKHTLAVMLMQNKDQVEQPIAFFSRTIRDATLHYNIIEKQALALIKALKDFQVYIMHSHTIAYVPNTVVKDVLMQINPEEIKGKWIAAMLEYDLEIKPTKLIKGQGLEKLMAELNLHALDINLIAAMSDDEDGGTLIQVLEMFLNSLWYSDIVYVLQHLSPPLGMSRSKGRSLKLKSAKFYILDSSLYWKDLGGVLFNCLVEDEAPQFLESNILSRFGFPHKIITDNAAAFKSKKMIEFCNKYNITLGHSTVYYPQGNGIVESSNKSLVNIIKKMLEANKNNFHEKIFNALWAYRVSNKKLIGMSPFELVYGTNTVFPTSLVVPVMRLLQEAGSEEDDSKRQINQMIHLQQTREEVFQNTFRLQEKIKKIYDRKIKEKKFQLEDVVLRWDAQNEENEKHGKFDNLWKGPYKISAYRG
eukprot:PITA_18507